MIVSDIRDFLEQLGYKVQVSGMHREHMALWREWYRGKVDSFHNYTVYNGVKEVKRTKKTLGMAKKSCEDWADLLLNEKVMIQVDRSRQKQLDECLTENNFRDQANALVEKAFALGTGALVEYRSRDRKSGCKIDYVPAGMIFPLRQENGMIVDAAFASELSEDRYYVNIHEYQNGRYRIENVIFDAEKGGKYVVEEVPEGMERVIYSDVPLFQIIRPNAVNNSDMDEAMGIAVYANALDEMQEIDEIFDSYFNEFQLGKKRIFLDPSVVNVTVPVSGPNVRPAFDPDDVSFYGLNGLGEDGKKIEQTDFNLRVAEHSQALQDALNLFGDKVGFGSDYYVFKEGKVYTNTTDIISSNSKMFRRLKKHELILERALKGMVRAVLHIAGSGYTGDIQVDFDDSIIEDKAAERKQYKEDVAAGIMSPVEYRMRVYGEDKATAESMIPEQNDVMS